MGGFGFSESPPGSRAKPDRDSVIAAVLTTGRPARCDADGSPSEAIPAGGRSAIASPIVVEDRVWGAVGVGSRGDRLPSVAEQRLGEFTELVATAIANTESRAELTTSRARIVAAADDARRRIERNLHDGAQQRLVSLALLLGTAQAAVPPELGTLGAQLGDAVARVTGALDELRETSRGIHPSILAEAGLGAALRGLARRSPIPVDLDVHVDQRLPEQIELASYYFVAEAATNAAKHASASAVAVTVEADAANVVLRVEVSDDGVGGADFTRGTGLVGLQDRLAALGGRIFLHSPHGGGTTLRMEVPLTAANRSATS